MFLSFLFILSASSSYESKLEELSQEVKELKESVKALQALLIKPHETVDDVETNGMRLPPILTIYPSSYWGRRSSNSIPTIKRRLCPLYDVTNAIHSYRRTSTPIYEVTRKDEIARAHSSRTNSSVIC